MEKALNIHFVPKQSNPDDELTRQKLEQQAQNCVDHLVDGGDYKIWGSALSGIGASWSGRSRDHDIHF